MAELKKFKESCLRKLLSVLLTGIALSLSGSFNVIAENARGVEPSGIQQNERTVTGVVTDRSGDPLIGVSVRVQGTTEGSVTDVEGRFSIKVKDNNQVLLFSYVGYKTASIVAKSNVVNLALEEDAKLIDEVVVVGYGTQKRVNLTGAVSTVDVSKVLEARPQSDVIKGLQGVVPGLTILPSSGELNATPEIRIRGVGTLSNDAKSNPLILVDGVAMDDISYLNTQDIENISVLKDAASSSIYGARAAFGVLLITTKSAKKVDRVSINYVNNFAWETPTILPDYPDVPTQLRALINANDRAGMESELFGMYLKEMLPKAEAWQQKHGGKTGYREMVYGDDFELSSGGRGLFYADWDVVGIMFRKYKPSQNHNVSIQGSSGKTSYFMSLGYNHQEGVLNFNPDKLDKYNATMNVNTDVYSWLKVGGRFNYSTKDYTYPYQYRTPYQYIWRWGSFFPYGTYQGEDFRTEPGYMKQANDCTTTDANTRFGGYMQATLTKGLTLNADYTYNIRHYNNNYVGGPVYLWDFWSPLNLDNGPTDVASAGYKDVSMESRQYKSYVFNAYANYEFTLDNKHNFKAMAGVNAEEGDNFMHSSYKLGLLDKTKGEFDLATGAATVDGWHNQWGVAGYFGRINYDYEGKYLLELNGRYDGSSKFPSHSRWAFFPSASIGYRISEEPFMQPLRPYLSDAKIRASYGEIGNQAVGDNMFISTIANITAGNTYWIDNGAKATMYDLPKLVSTTLLWERIQTTNIGGDFGFLNNDLVLSAEWFQRDTKDMLAPGKTMPQVLGTTAPYVNAGSLRTSGWELNLNWRHRFNDVNVYAGASISDYITKVTQWDNPEKLLNQNYTGKIVGEIWGFETDRLFTEADFNADGTVKDGIASQVGLEQGQFHFGPGDIKFKNLDGDNIISGGKGSADDHGDLKVIGNRTPRYQYSFRLGGDWKGFDLDVFFQGVGKRQEWTVGAFVMPMMRGADAIYANQTDYWTEENKNYNAEFPRMFPGNAGQGNIASISSGNHNFYPQSKYLVNMAYLRLKNLTFGYTVPKVYTQKAYIQKARIYFSALNLAELINKSKAPVDPEINAVDRGSNGLGAAALGNGTWGRIDPMYRSYSFGIQVTF
ncbi:SusC/RagA family TonB-linked outer membrane protein [Bacteroidia bacterium]|nr:SusC/RagA family TonB-linked outer membrane protein [Bacteroidia bacterium]